MTVLDFKQSVNFSEPPYQLSVQLQALWWQAKGDWRRAHDLVDHLDDQVSAHIHAYLHRVEGDFWNAGYWYHRAKQPEYKGTLNDEWDYLLNKYL